jgi:cytochrome c oxidase assembly factor CtaG
MLYLHVAELLLSTMITSLSFVLAYLYWLGLTHARREGKEILRAIVYLWLIIGIIEAKATAIEVAAIFEEAPILDETHYIMTIPGQILLMLVAVYFLMATVRRNPPQTIKVETDAVHDGLDDRAK